MKSESRHPIHMGINFVISPPPIINAQSYLQFQKSLVSCSVEFTSAARRELPQEHRIEVVRGTPKPLQVVVIASASQPIGQLLILATPEPGRPLEYFIQEAEQVVEGFEATWPAPNRQIIKQDVALRDLYETTRDHAFQELWEERLGQEPDSLAVLDRLVLGGGLRFVMPPQPGKPAQVEVKIESYLKDTGKLFVETQFAWHEPMPPGAPLDPRERLLEVNNYVENQVLAFMGVTK